ncbi:MAG: TetR/AcrR family transcriptional regulator [Anaerolineae bacterium]|jgi:AcrR family transcriptional regulator
MSEAASRREQMREERRSQILASALAVFSQKGFHVSSVSDVAAHAGVSQGTIYWYFDSKEELFDAAILEYFADFGTEMTSALEGGGTASEKLRALAKNMDRFVAEAQQVLVAFLSYWASGQGQQKSAQLWIEVLQEYADYMVTVIEEGISTGEFKEVDARGLVWAMSAAYDGLAAYAMFIPEIDVERVSAAFVDTLLQGLQVEV